CLPTRHIIITFNRLTHRLPGIGAPYLDIIENTGDDHFAVNGRKVAQILRQHDTTLAVWCEVHSTRENPAAERAHVFVAKRPGGNPFCQRFPLSQREYHQILVKPTGDNESGCQLTSEFRRDGDSTFVIDGVCILTEKHCALTVFAILRSRSRNGWRIPTSQSGRSVVCCTRNRTSVLNAPFSCGFLSL